MRWFGKRRWHGRNAGTTKIQRSIGSLLQKMLGQNYFGFTRQLRVDETLAVNRAYYSVFYAMRAFLATVNKDSSKHSGVISFFNQHFIKTKIVPEVNFKAIQSLMDLRHESDYQDFVEITKEEAIGSVETAKTMINSLKDVLEQLLKK